jgi:halocyanin-like protein
MKNRRTDSGRRRLLALVGSGLVAGLAGCSGGGDGGDGGGDGGDGGGDGGDGGGDGTAPSFGGWMSGVSNYERVVDETGTDEIAVAVGVEANGGAYGFGPAAVRVDPGTTVVWEWTGKGQQHNVVAEEGGSFESELSAQEGFTFEHTFSEAGTYKYVCTPHRSLGMKGVVVVE